MPTKIGNIHVHNVLVCDDVRREESKKEIIIGVYGTSLVPISFPALLRLVFWVQLSSDSVGKFPCNFRLINSAGTEFFNVQGEMDVVVAGELSSLAVGGTYSANSEDLLFFQARADASAEWTTLRQLKIQAPTPIQ